MGVGMAKLELYIEKTKTGEYAVRIPGSERASAVRRTQAEAIERARQMYPDAIIYVERVGVRFIGGRDRWRKL